MIPHHQKDSVLAPSKATTETQAVSATKNRGLRSKSSWPNTKGNKVELPVASCTQEFEPEVSAQQAACFERTREEKNQSSEEVKETSEERAEELSAQELVEDAPSVEIIKETSRKPVILISGTFGRKEIAKSDMESIYNALTEYLPSCEHHTDEREDILLPSNICALDCTSFEHDSHTIEEDGTDSSAAEKVKLVAIENDQPPFDGPREIYWDDNQVLPNKDVADTEYVDKMQKLIAEINNIERAMHTLLNKSTSDEDAEERNSTAEKVKLVAIKNEYLSFDSISEISFDNKKVSTNKKDAIMDSEEVYEMQKLVAQRIHNLDRAMNRVKNRRAKNNKSRDSLQLK